MNTRMGTSRVGLAAILTVAVGCSGGVVPEESVGQTQQALNGLAESVSGFENASDWSVTGGTATLSGRHTQGEHSLQVASSGRVSATSSKLAGPVNATSLLAVDVILARPQQPNWNGQVLLTLNAPSVGLHGVTITGTRFAFPYGTFQRAQFQLPAEVVQKLNQTYDDLQITVIVEGAAGTYFLDNLRFISTAEGAKPVASVDAGMIMDFEDPAFWSTLAPGVSTDSHRRVRGAHSLAVSTGGWTRVESAPMSAPETLGSKVAFNLVALTPCSGWCGQIELRAAIPSIGMAETLLGKAELSNVPVGQYRRIQFEVSNQLRDKFASSSYSDLRFTFVVNSPWGQTKEYLLDNLRFRTDDGTTQDPELLQALVSTDWLEQHGDLSALVIVDVRSATDYAAGHIPSAINIPFAMPESAWVAMRDGLLMEVPEQAALFATLGSNGIKKNSRVVLVNTTSGGGAVPDAYPRAQTARAAITLQYAGVNDVSVLDGGFTKWVAEGKAQETAVATPAVATYDGQTDPLFFASKSYVSSSIGTPTALLDGRDANVYNGTVVEPFAPRPGHIPGAVNLPAPEIWNADGTYKSEDTLRSLVVGALGEDRSREIIVYCGVGGYASPWTHVLTKVLGYTNVRFYDGSAQEWAADPNAPLETN